MNYWKFTFKSLRDGREWVQTLKDTDQGYKEKMDILRTTNSELVNWKYIEGNK